LGLGGLLRSAAGNEGRQPIDVAAAFVCNRLGRAWHALLERGCRERLRVRRQIGLRLAGSVCRFAPARRRLLLHIVFAVIAIIAVETALPQAMLRASSAVIVL